MRYEQVKVKRDTQTAYNKLVLPWEIAILEEIFEAGNVERTDVFETVAGEYPEAAIEFDRLVRAYGADSKSGVPFVATVYGDSARGIRELKRAIDEARKAEADAEPKVSGRRAKAQQVDPLTV